MPNIRVSDDIYERLKGFADKEMRSVANATEFLLSLQLGNATGVPEKTSPAPKKYEPPKFEDPIIPVKPMGIVTPEKKSAEATPREVDIYESDMEFCKHNAVKGMCKRGCK